MKNNNLDGNQEFEKLLKDKMNELSSSVDCFDRISAKAFPEKNPDFSESGFTVCDLENVTGKSRKPLFLKWTAIAVACAVCAVIIPRTPLLDNLMASFGKSSKKTYSKIIDEINAETSRNTYKVYDIPLEDYIRYDTLVTPLYSCPFSDCGKDNINVRIFVRMYNDIPTNQIYAVEYADEYRQSNFIAVADTKAKFTDEDFKYIDEIYQESDDTAVRLTVQANFVPAITAESYITDKSKNKVSLASFEYGNIFKSDNEKIYYSPSQILYYGDKIDEPSEKYYFDIINTPDIGAENSWKDAVSFDGFSSMPEESKSLFIRTPLFDNRTSDCDISYAYVTPNLPLDIDDESYTDGGIDFYTLDLCVFRENSIRNNQSMLAVPYDTEVLKTLKMYFSQCGLMFSSSSYPAIDVTSVNTSRRRVMYSDDENYHVMLYENEQEEILQEQIESSWEKAKSEEEARQDIISSSDVRF